MNGGWLGVLALVLGLAAGLARAEAVDLDTCTDAAGRAIAGEADPALKVLVKVGKKDGQTVMRYNPDLLPDLSATVRQFFYAQACARLSVGNRPGAVRAADCAAAEMLRAGGLLGEGGDALARLQAELVFADETWAQLPGPRRSFDFGACPRGAGLILPEPKPATDRQREWDACVRHCGDRLYRCPGRGAGAGCQEAYDACQAACRR